MVLGCLHGFDQFRNQDARTGSKRSANHQERLALEKWLLRFQCLGQGWNTGWSNLFQHPQHGIAELFLGVVQQGGQFRCGRASGWSEQQQGVQGPVSDETIAAPQQRSVECDRSDVLNERTIETELHHLQAWPDAQGFMSSRISRQGLPVRSISRRRCSR